MCSGANGIDFVKFFICVGAIFLILFVITLFLPETGTKKQNT